MIHHFANDQQSIAVGRIAHQAQSFFAEALEAVRRCARLERAAPDHLRAGFSDNLRDPLDLILRLHTARTGHHDHTLAADFERADLHHGPARPEAAAGQLVRRCNAVHALDTRGYFENRWIEIARAHAAEHRVHNPRRTMDVESQLHQPVDHGLYLRFGCAFLHHD